MDFMLNFLQTDLFTILLSVMIILLFILYLVNVIKLSKLNKNYRAFLKRIGKGTDLSDTLNEYMDKTEQVQQRNQEIIEYCKRINEDMTKCIQKVGIVRYSAFKDTGSDLSFALALLDNDNNGVVLNGIYSREMSNIYAKPVQAGNSTYTMSEEEKQAVEKAIHSLGNIIKE